MRLVGATPRQVSVDRRGRVDRRRRRRHRRRVRPVLRCSARRWSRDPVHRRAVLPRRPVARAARRPASSRSACRSARRSRPGSRCAGCGSPRSASAAGSRRDRRGPGGWCRSLAGLGRAATCFIGRRPGHARPASSRPSCPASCSIMVGLVIAGPWLTMVAARVLARASGGRPDLLAARRLADDPRAGFRAVSGLVLALFVTSTAVAVMQHDGRRARARPPATSPRPGPSSRTSPSGRTPSGEPAGAGRRAARRAPRATSPRSTASGARSRCTPIRSAPRCASATSC